MSLSDGYIDTLASASVHTLCLSAMRIRPGESSCCGRLPVTNMRWTTSMWLSWPAACSKPRQASADAEQAAARDRVALQQQLVQQAQQHTAQQDTWHAERADLQQEVQLLVAQVRHLEQQRSDASTSAAAAAEDHAAQLVAQEAQLAAEQHSLAQLSDARHELQQLLEAAEQGKRDAEASLAQQEQQASATQTASLQLQVPTCRSCLLLACSAGYSMCCTY